MRLSLPSSILLAGAFVGLGLYLGLRGQAPATPPATTQPAVPEPARASPQPPPVQYPSPEKLQAEVTALVVGAKPRWKAACWDTADPATRKPGRYVSALAFDATGTLNVSGVSEFRDVGDGNVAQCMRRLVNDDFRITPPGQTVTFEIPFEMP